MMRVIFNFQGTVILKSKEWNSETAGMFCDVNVVSAVNSLVKRERNPLCSTSNIKYSFK